MSMTLVEFMPTLTADSQAKLKGMLAKAGITHNPPAKELISTLSAPGIYKLFDMGEKLVLAELLRFERDRFRSKFTFPQRCEILALHRAGITRETIAQLYGINIRTVSNVYTPTAIAYKDVREREKELGPELFRDTYLSQETLDRAMAYRQIREVKSTLKMNKHADSKRGMHQVRGKFCEQIHRVIISWKEVGDRMNDMERIEIAGWYFHDMDGNFPDQWQFVDEKSMVTSEACYRAMLENIMDK